MGNNRYTDVQTQPAREVMPVGNRLPIVATVVFGLLLVSILLAVSDYLLENYSPNAGYRLERAKWELLLQQDRAVDVLVLGDSSAFHGVDTEYLMASTGLTALNLSTTATAIAVNDYWMLEEYIDRVGPPACVLVGHVYDLWYQKINYSLVAQIPIDGDSLQLRLMELDDSYTTSIKFLIAKHARAYSENLSMRKLLIYPWSARKISPIRLVGSGFYPTTHADPENVNRDADRHLDWVKTQVFEPSNENRISLTRMIELADKYSFHLYLTNSPLYEGVLADDSFRRYLDDVNHFVSEATNKSQHATHLFPTPKTYKNYQMQNIDHLVGDAAKQFTQEIIENIDCGPNRAR